MKAFKIAKNLLKMIGENNTDTKGKEEMNWIKGRSGGGERNA